MNKSVRPGLILALVVFLFSLIAKIVVMPDPPRDTSGKKECVKNMNMIKGSAELYIIENEGVAGTLEVKTLVEKAFIKIEPKCRKTIPASYDIILRTLAKDSAISGVKTSEVVVDVSCAWHGVLSKQETDHRYMGREASDPSQTNFSWAIHALSPTEILIDIILVWSFFVFLRYLFS